MDHFSMSLVCYFQLALLGSVAITFFLLKSELEILQIETKLTFRLTRVLYWL